ncbi:hypothetical protein Vretimale_11634 [Volvox reticuliferus]|uniref:Phosphoglycerate kinase n=1 Tax=Volvox reticuliferus TaxID=1737510 RepID=A0A8J4LR47_9CHLO|nr:hypothetical protein Vretifemale_14775 [Volvox reticuliferus]GIM07528.1 hypothetical protein Vretimale_11634 [Volvox reticuliferus]
MRRSPVQMRTCAGLQPCRRMMSRAAELGTRLLLPSDVLWSSSLSRPEQLDTTGVTPLTLDCCTPDRPCIPAGKFEVPEFAVGTVAVARALDEASKRGAVTIIGGSDSVAAVTAAGLAEHITHISTGGGATLELIEGKGMPGLRALLRHGSGGAGVCGGGGGGSRSSTSDSVAAGGIPFDDKR